MPADPSRTDQPLDARAIRRHFARAAATYDSAAVLQKEVGARMAERLDVVWFASACVHQVDRELLEAFRAAGCWAILFGAESGVQRNLDALRAIGYRAPQQTLARIAALRDSNRVRLMPQASHARMEQLVPLVIEIAARQSNPVCARDAPHPIKRMAPRIGRLIVRIVTPVLTTTV